MGIMTIVAIRRAMCIRSNSFWVFNERFRTLRSWWDSHNPTLARHALQYHPSQNDPIRPSHLTCISHHVARRSG